MFAETFTPKKTPSNMDVPKPLNKKFPPNGKPIRKTKHSWNATEMRLGNPVRITAGHKKKAKPKKTKNYRSECLREALSQEKLPSNINVPTETAKLKNQYNRQNIHEAQPKWYSAIRFVLSPAIQKKSKTEKTKNSRKKCVRKTLPLEKLPSNMDVPTETAKQKNTHQTANLQYKRPNSHEAQPK